MKRKELLSQLWTGVVCAVVIWGIHDTRNYRSSPSDAIEVVDHGSVAVSLQRFDNPPDGRRHTVSLPVRTFFYQELENLLRFQSNVRTQFLSMQSRSLAVDRIDRFDWHAHTYQAEEPPLLLV